MARSGKRTNNTIFRKSLRIQEQKKYAEQDSDVKRYQELLKKDLEKDIPLNERRGREKQERNPMIKVYWHQ